ncbi:VPLPA-CTERM sorting domain-containing protein [Primorskyibacter sp. S187A]|uniref:VPLPA-CTERM sorting domain-containing protein n=1 Tax=Primorskyibacter sp. S187A TaxID=3415130 RepID=UPI003C7977F2
MFKPIVLAMALCSVASSAAAALIYDQTLIPNSSSNSTTFFDVDNDFNESFDFSAVNYTSIDRFELTLDVSGSSDESAFFGLIPEVWAVRVQGSDGSSFFDDSFAAVSDGAQTITIDASSDVLTIDAFANSVGSGEFTFWLSEFSPDTQLRNPSITVSSARLQVFGTLAPIPLPAGLPLLLAGLGGMMLLRRKTR